MLKRKEKKEKKKLFYVNLLKYTRGQYELEHPIRPFSACVCGFHKLNYSYRFVTPSMGPQLRILFPNWITALSPKNWQARQRSAKD